MATGVWRDERKTLAPVAGFDLVFSCPKSVSLLHALTDDEGVRRAISDAHEASWRVALGYLEREACVVRRGRGGAIREHGGGFAAAADAGREKSNGENSGLAAFMRNGNAMRASYVPGLDYPKLWQYYGARWEFRN